MSHRRLFKHIPYDLDRQYTTAVHVVSESLGLCLWWEGPPVTVNVACDQR